MIMYCMSLHSGDKSHSPREKESWPQRTFSFIRRGSSKRHHKEGRFFDPSVSISHFIKLIKAIKCLRLISFLSDGQALENDVDQKLHSLFLLEHR